MTTRRPETLTALVAEYLAEWADGRQEIMDDFANVSVDAAIDAVARAQLADGSRDPHQYRRTKRSLRLGGRLIRNARSRLKRATGFEKLHAILIEITDKVRGLGELFAYDGAVRIGAARGFAPSDVYLHAGTRRGARNLGLHGAAPNRLVIGEVRRALRRLTPDQIEDFLCIYEDDLARFAPKRRTARRSKPP